MAKNNSTKDQKALANVKIQIPKELHTRFWIVLCRDGVSLRDAVTEMIAKHVAKREAAVER